MCLERGTEECGMGVECGFGFGERSNVDLVLGVSWKCDFGNGELGNVILEMEKKRNGERGNGGAEREMGI